MAIIDAARKSNERRSTPLWRQEYRKKKGRQSVMLHQTNTDESWRDIYPEHLKDRQLHFD